jgi:molybdopterin synthase catalytic subunit
MVSGISLGLHVTGLMKSGNKRCVVGVRSPHISKWFKSSSWPEGVFSAL